MRKIIAISIIFAWISVGVGVYCYHLGFRDGEMAGNYEIKAALKLKNDLKEAPIVRVGIINARLRETLEKYGIDAEKEGVYK